MDGSHKDVSLEDIQENCSGTVTQYGDLEHDMFLTLPRILVYSRPSGTYALEPWTKFDSDSDDEEERKFDDDDDDVYRPGDHIPYQHIAIDRNTIYICTLAHAHICF